MRSYTLRMFILWGLVCFLILPQLALSDDIILENDTLKVQIEEKSGCFTVTEKISNQKWVPDPWEKSAGLLTLIDSGKKITVDLSKSSEISLKKINPNEVRIDFNNPVSEDGAPLTGISVSVKLVLEENKAILHASVLQINSISEFQLMELMFPARHFSLKTDVDRGAGVIPQWQGIICPSYIFPMTGGRFCQWDDAVYDKRSVGRLRFYDFVGGLSMPWFGTYNENSAVVGILNENPQAELDYNINNNGQYLFDAKGTMSPYPRILALSPVWNLRHPNVSHNISYYFIPGGNYVQMAKKYRKIAIERGYFLSLRDKVKQNPNVDKLAGAIYLGVYGGYPHYVNMSGMAFTFDRLKHIIKDTHDNLWVDKAFVHAWGTFSNYPPMNWPISEELGGPAKLREAVDLAKEYGYLYSSYHAYSPRLEHDPNFNLDFMRRDKDGNPIVSGSRWNRVDSEYFLDLAKENLPKEIAEIGQNADVTDIIFIGTPDPGRVDLAKYLRSLNLVMATERGQEHWIPYFDAFEGMTYYYSNVNGVPISTVSHKAPLFNLVYHDAIANYGKIQDPDNDITMNGDFRTKSLRNILYGNGTLIFFAPYEYEGMREMIKMADELVAPVHRETFYEELIDHEFLSADFQVQRSRFSNGVEVIANLGPVDQQIKDGSVIPGYGFKITDKEGKVKSGQFKLSLEVK
mgnify:CR=1 FL=1